MPVELPQTIVPNPAWRIEVAELSGHNVSACYQCEKCTNGCPVSFAMDIVPHKLMRVVHLGLKEVALRSNTLWVCASCETCTTRCPNGIDIAHIMDTLRQMSVREGMKPARESTPSFHSSFLSSIKRYGRIHELEMIAGYTIRNEGLKGLLKQAGLGLGMFMKGKITLPRSYRANRQVRNIFSQVEGKGQP